MAEPNPISMKTLLLSLKLTTLCLILMSLVPTQVQAQKPVVIFDTDMGSDCDDAGALALLHAYADTGWVDILGCIYSSGKVPYGAGVVDAINVYYGRGDIPVGAAHTDEVGDPADKMTAEKLAKDQAAFGNTIVHNHDAPEQTALNRALLANQPDNSVTYLTVGHTKGLYDLLVSGPDSISPLTGMELVEKKVKQWVALGALGASKDLDEWRERDWNFTFNGTAPYTEYLVKNFPKPAFFINAGAFPTGKSLKNTPAGNIVRTAYRDWLWNYGQTTLDDQRPSWDLAAVYFAVEGLGDFLRYEKTGQLAFEVAKGYNWILGDSGKTHHLVLQKAGVDAAFSNYLNAWIGKKPSHQAR